MACPSCIRAYTTLRTNGVSLPPYASFNLGFNSGDNPQHVTANREILQTRLNLPNEPIWLKQTHSTLAISAEADNRNKEADASFTHQSNQVCAILTADCLPILLCDRKRFAHCSDSCRLAGLAHGIIENTVKALALPGAELLAWLGPAIGPLAYEVGNEVRDQFITADKAAADCFQAQNNGRWLADLYSLAKLRLQKQKIIHIYGGNYCTFSDQERFFSYRREGEKTGRMASLIWITHH